MPSTEVVLTVSRSVASDSKYIKASHHLLHYLHSSWSITTTNWNLLVCVLLCIQHLNDDWTGSVKPSRFIALPTESCSTAWFHWAASPGAEPILPNKWINIETINYLLATKCLQQQRELCHCLRMKLLKHLIGHYFLSQVNFIFQHSAHSILKPLVWKNWTTEPMNK